MRIHSLTKDQDGNVDFHVDMTADETAKLIHYAIYITFLGGLQEQIKNEDGSFDISLKDLPDEAYYTA